MFDNILTKDEVSFKDLEEICFKIACEISKELLKTMLEEFDNKILKERDKEIFRNKGLKDTTVKTILGEVAYKRRMYINNESQKCEFLLDNKLNIKDTGLISENVINLIIDNIKDLSYRACSKVISTISGLSISATAIWNVIQILGERIKIYEEEKVKSMEEDKLKSGEKEIPIIYQEADGVMIYTQGKDRKIQIEKYKKEHPNEDVPKKVRNIELKLGMSYEGWKEIGKNRYELIGKEYVSGYMTGEKMAEIMNSTLYSKYDMKKVEMRILNSDGGSWIQKLLVRGAIYQADSYHIKEKISLCVKEQEDVKELNKMFWNKEYEKMIDYVEILKYKYDGEYEEVEKLNILKKYLEKRKSYMKRYNSENKVKLKLKEYSQKTGLKYRNMGCQESNNYSLIARRMKKRRMSWSQKGSENIAKVIAARASESTKDIVSKLTVNRLPESFIEYAEKYIQEIENNIKLMKKNKVKKVKEKREIKTFSLESYPNIRKILEIKPISELIYR